MVKPLVIVKYECSYAARKQAVAEIREIIGEDRIGSYYLGDVRNSIYSLRRPDFKNQENRRQAEHMLDEMRWASVHTDTIYLAKLTKKEWKAAKR